MDLQLDVELQGLEVSGLRGFLGISTLGFRVCIVGVPNTSCEPDKQRT